MRAVEKETLRELEYAVRQLHAVVFAADEVWPKTYYANRFQAGMDALADEALAKIRSMWHYLETGEKFYD